MGAMNFTSKEVATEKSPLAKRLMDIKGVMAVMLGTNFVTEVVDDGKGALFSKVVKVIPDVNQTLGYDPAVFAKIGLPSRTVPECKKY